MSSYFSLVFWRICKWILRLLTGKCELQRICQKTEDVPIRTVSIARSLRTSKHEDLKRIVDSSQSENVEPDNALQIILRIKKIPPEKDPNFVARLNPCLLPIIGYTVLKGDVEQMRKEQYSLENTEHEQLLTKLWSLLLPDIELKDRFGNHWGTIGFQGKDPATDFRGMGILGLQCLVYFAEMHNGKARQIHGHSQHLTKGYPLAITSINITSILYNMIMDNTLEYYYYLTTEGRVVTVTDFMEAHCYILYSFNKFWLDAEPENIMAFSSVRDSFVRHLRQRLKERPLVIRLSLVQD